MTQVRLDLIGRVSVEKKASVRNERTSSPVLPQRKDPEKNWGLAELEESSAVTSESRRLGKRLKTTTGKC